MQLFADRQRVLSQGNRVLVHLRFLEGRLDKRPEVGFDRLIRKFLRICVRQSANSPFRPRKVFVIQLRDQGQVHESPFLG